jgi:hypothetical protein
MNYNDINSFKIQINIYLFCDIFHKNNELVLICPMYYNKSDNSMLNYDNIIIKYNNHELKIKHIYKKINSEPVIILIYEFNTINISNHITVIYNNINKKYTLLHYISSINKLLVQSTLMKDDYKLIKQFYNYYTKQGVEYFYIYYNGKLCKDIKLKYKKQNILLIEWDFIYFHKKKKYKFKHHAQPAQIHHALYKYGKNESKYMIFNDLDEYMHIPNITLYNYVLKYEYDTIMFINYWAKQIDDNNIMIADYLEPPDRAKCIHKTNSIDIINIHHSYQYNINNYTQNIDKSNMLIHFFNWSNPSRNIITNNVYNFTI